MVRNDGTLDELEHELSELLAKLSGPTVQR